MIDIKLEEGKFYYVRYFNWRKKLVDIHGYLDVISLDERTLTFDREGQGKDT